MGFVHVVKSWVKGFFCCAEKDCADGVRGWGRPFRVAVLDGNSKVRLREDRR